MLRVVESRLRHGAELRRSSALRLIARSQSTTPGRTGAARTFALMTAHLPYAPAARELRRPARRAARRSAAAPPKRFVDPLLVALCGAGFGITLGLALAALLPLTLTASGILYAIQSLAACAGAYLVLVEFLLISRAPFIERAIGQDSLVAAHKLIGPWALWLIVVHIALVVPASVRGSNWISAGWAFILSDQWLFLALVGTACFLALGLTSWKRIRGRLARQRWWTIHLYAYLGIALAFGHQIFSGGPFLSGFGRVWWVGLYCAVGLAVLTWRVIVPIRSSIVHDLRVAAVVPETRDACSVWISGRGLDSLGARAGQFLNVRFWHKGLFFEGHPYSLSAPPTDSMLRITVKALGDASRLTAGIPVGTRVFIEGPYGVMTSSRARTSRALLIAGGIGIAPMRALAESLAPTHQVELLVRSRDIADLALSAELDALDALPNLRVRTLIGPRAQHPIDAASLAPSIRDPRSIDVYACGPEALLDSVRAAARALGVPADRIHIESFDM